MIDPRHGIYWQSFFKGSLVTTFLLLLSLTATSLGLQVRQELVLAQPVKGSIYLAARTGTFPAVLAAQTAADDTNILLLGLDSRKEDKSARCDAIHMISVKPVGQKIIITTLPRGTLVGGTYIANTCSVGEIEKITGIKADHVVKVGFSQVLGALRLAGLSTTPTLQFLRDRSYPIGDYQRSYNQAVFLKDMFLNNFERLANLPEVVQYLGFKLVDTDMTFDQAKQLLQMVKRVGAKDIDIEIRPKDAVLRQEIHFAENDNQWQDEQEYQAYQKGLVNYLETAIAKKQVADALAKKLWLQIEDASTRNRLHYEVLKIAPDRDLIENFILEMTQFGTGEEKALAEELLTTLTN